MVAACSSVCLVVVVSVWLLCRRATSPKQWAKIILNAKLVYQQSLAAIHCTLPTAVSLVFWNTCSYLKIPEVMFASLTAYVYVHWAIWMKPVLKVNDVHVQFVSLQGVVTYTSPVEVFATGIKNLDWWKSSLITWFYGSSKGQNVATPAKFLRKCTDRLILVA